MSLSQRLGELIAAAFTGIWIQSFEHADARPSEMSLDTYSVGKKKQGNKVQYRSVLDDVERHKGNCV